jgi:hypothetical protein
MRPYEASAGVVAQECLTLRVNASPRPPVAALGRVLSRLAQGSGSGPARALPPSLDNA